MGIEELTKQLADMQDELSKAKETINSLNVEKENFLKSQEESTKQISDLRQANLDLFLRIPQKLDEPKETEKENQTNETEILSLDEISKLI